MLSAGTRVGPYEILAPLGAGGMGEVYRARDPRLEREVALKVLPGEAPADPERLARFQREARAVAALNHPHILAVFDVGSDQGVDYVVFELLEGHTFRQRLESGPLPASKVVEYGVQICRGLAAAHERGIVHRDLKPANLFLTARGQVKILDFGLAKQTGPADPDDLASAEGVTDTTQTGRVLGTVGYMSPEQARGERADARSDLFALGAVLYEMLSGRRAFGGQNQADTLAAVLRSDPPAMGLDDVPPALERAVRHCLEKNPDERFQSAHDLGLTLKTLSGPASPTPGSTQRPRTSRLSTGAGLAVTLVVTVAVGMWWLRSRQPKGPTSPERIVPLTADGGYKFAPRLSPDGERVAYSWAGPRNDNWDIYVKGIGRGTRPLRLTEDKAADWGPIWSPDGRELAFVREFDKGATIYTVPSLGGQERRLVDVVGAVRSPGDWSLIPFLSWSPDGEWLALSEKPGEGEPARIVRLSLATLEKQPLTFPPAASLGDLYPELSPDGRDLAFVRAGGDWGFQDVWVQAVNERQARRLTSATYNFCSGLTWTTGGAALVFATGTNGRTAGGQIVRVPEAGGVPTPLAGVGGDVAWPSVRAGRMVHAQLLPSPWGVWRMPGRRSSLADRKPEKLIASRWNDQVGAYSPDGRRFAFTSDRSGTDSVWVSNLDGSEPVQVTAFQSFLPGTGAPWSPDGRKLVLISQEKGGYYVYLADTEGGRPQRLTEGGPASFSRDGHSIYFCSDRGGRSIWRMPVDGGPATPVMRGDGFYVEESRDGRFVYYSEGATEAIWRVPVEGGEATPVVRGVGYLSGWDLSAAGLYYGISQQHELSGEDYTIRFLDFVSGRAETLFRKKGPFLHDSLVVSPDERWIAFGEHPVPQSELMLVENFR